MKNLLERLEGRYSYINYNGNFGTLEEITEERLMNILLLYRAKVITFEEMEQLEAIIINYKKSEFINHVNKFN